MQLNGRHDDMEAVTAPMEMEVRALAVKRPRDGTIHQLSAQKPTYLGECQDHIR